jgi:hypothetical protein
MEGGKGRGGTSSFPVSMQMVGAETHSEKHFQRSHKKRSVSKGESLAWVYFSKMRIK